MQYEGDIIRPPSEAHSIILQVTVGCSHNACTFCGAYRDKHFRVKNESTIKNDLEFAAKYCKNQKTLFLADGDALVIPQDNLVQLLTLIREKLPHIRRIALYANSQDILSRSVEDLEQLRELGLKRIYMGLESGHDPTLQAIAKGSDSRKMILAGKQVRQAGIFLSVTVLLGIAGLQYSTEHAVATALVLNQMSPNQIAVLTLMLLENTPLYRKYKSGVFQMPDQHKLFMELRNLIMHLNDKKVQFQSNHASNYFSLNGRLPRDKDFFLSRIDQALAGTVDLKPDHLRAL